MTIRQATDADLDAVAELWRSLTKDQHRYTRTTRTTKENVRLMREHLAKLVPHGQVLVAEDAGTVVGFTAVVVNLPPLDTFYASATITDLFIASTHRGRGVGRGLFRAAVALVRDRGLHAATLTVASGNEDARRMYYEEGFRSLSEQMILPLDPDFVRFGPDAQED
jgi:ribosomal protein S18 acetylase RimI-like enzyme